MSVDIDDPFRDLPDLLREIGDNDRLDSLLGNMCRLGAAEIERLRRELQVERQRQRTEQDPNADA